MSDTQASSGAVLARTHPRKAGRQAAHRPCGWHAPILQRSGRNGDSQEELTTPIPWAPRFRIMKSTGSAQSMRTHGSQEYTDGKSKAKRSFFLCARRLLLQEVPERMRQELHGQREVLGVPVVPHSSIPASVQPLQVERRMGTWICNHQ